MDDEPVCTTDATDNQIIVNLTLVPQCKVSRQEIVYACKFYVPPELQYYYYVPEPEITEKTKNKGILYSVPAFDGEFGSKWQVMICLNHWVEVTRWVSLYLARVDESTTFSPTLKLQCEVRIVDGVRHPLHSQKCVITPTNPGHSEGFPEFLPFKQALAWMSPENFLHFEFHMMIIKETPLSPSMPKNWEKIECKNASLNVAEPSEKMITPKASATNVDSNVLAISTVDQYEKNKESFWPDGEGISEDSKVLFFLGGELVGFADRAKLQELSEHYGKCLESDTIKYWSKMEFHRRGLTPSMSYVNRMTIHQYLQYVEYQGTDICTLEGGGFGDSRQLFEFAKDMETPDLMEHCVYGMCKQVTVKDAPLLVSFFKEYPEMVRVCWDDGVREFRNFFRKNLEEIQSDPTSRGLMEYEKEYFTKFLLDPELEFGGDENVDTNEDDIDKL